MTVCLDPRRLEREMTRRGWNATDLALASGCSPATISAARHGRPLSSSTIRRIAAALDKAPVIAGVDDLLGPQNGAVI